MKQLDNGVKIPPKDWQCQVCGLKENLWLNLTDGSIHCGRKYFNGLGGNNHAVEHYEKTKYPLVVKLGTVTSECSGENFKFLINMFKFCMNVLFSYIIICNVVT